jgi:hypothetical protein
MQTETNTVEVSIFPAFAGISLATDPSLRQVVAGGDPLVYSIQVQRLGTFAGAVQLATAVAAGCLPIPPRQPSTTTAWCRPEPPAARPPSD